jgi:hypothetical protein
MQQHRACKEPQGAGHASGEAGNARARLQPLRRVGVLAQREVALGRRDGDAPPDLRQLRLPGRLLAAQAAELRAQRLHLALDALIELCKLLIRQRNQKDLQK